MQIKTALITASGFGTRFLPVTKTIQKEMLPILTRPIIDYVVDDLISAGVQKIIIVISEHNMQPMHYYSQNQRLYSYLKKIGKLDQYDQVNNLHQKAKFVFIRQPDVAIYGTATPLVLAENELKNEPAFFVFMGDDCIFESNHQSAAKQMTQVFNQSQADGLVTCIEKPTSELSKYGVAKLKSKNGFSFLDTLVEKPAPGTAPSNLANISKYIFKPNVFEILKNQKPDDRSGELYITDTATQLAKQSPVVVHQPTGQYLDGGYPLGWLKANLTVAWEDPTLRQELKKCFQELK
ncbi:MAG: sugar phosphate nucleotidyltransferase [Patescibacteria group bacterium]